MRAVPPDFSLDHLIGRTLTAISFGAFDLHFLFAPNDDILCVGKVVVECEGRSSTVMDRSKRGDLNALTALPGQHVLNWRVEGSHEFAISLSGGAKLRFISSDGAQEDFVIFPGVQVV